MIKIKNTAQNIAFVLLLIAFFHTNAEVSYNQENASPNEIYETAYSLYTSTKPGDDVSSAAALFEEAAKQGHVESQMMLADMHIFGAPGVALSYEQGAYWYKKAADQGHPRAQLSIAELYAEGLGQQQDIDLARKYYQLAIDNADADDKTKRIASKRMTALY